jgi:hypothetical protein
MMNLQEYLEQVKLNKEDPDFQIEEFWYGLKNSMKNFYKYCGIKTNNINAWSEKLNNLKKEKQYSSIEELIKEYITSFAIDVMQNEKLTDCVHSGILLTNIKRWNKISNKFHFGDATRYKNITTIFDAYYCVKKKMDKQLYPLLELFNNVESLILSEYVGLLGLSIKLGQNKVLDSVIKISGDKALKLINELYPGLIDSGDKNTSGLKLCKKYNKMISSTI